jgi:hypothetical protein
MTLAFYRLLLRLYPAGYRSTFGKEMADVFQDLQAEAWSRGALYGSAFCIREFGGLLLGALRERAWPFEVPEPPAASPAPACDAVPTFYSCEDYALRRRALIQGGILSLAFFSAAMRHSSTV